MKNLKKIDWKSVFTLSILMTFFTFIFMLIENKISILQMILIFISCPIIALVLILTSNDNKVKPKPFHSVDYYISLTEFSKTDIVFYNEQLHQFTEDELDDYNIWLLNNYNGFNIKKNKKN